jgi:hypothetical protein
MNIIKKKTFIQKYFSIKELIEYLDSMATTNGYSATKTCEYKQNYNLHIKELKFLFNTFIEK